MASTPPELTGSPVLTAGAVANTVRERAQAELPQMLDDLSRWVAMDSPSGDPDALDSLAREIADTLDRYGADVELRPTREGAYLHASVRGGGRGRVALLCHHDTVFARGAAADRPMTCGGDVVRGPGVADMKGGLVVAAHAMRLLVATAPGAYEQVRLISAPDEEVRTTPFRGLEDLAEFDAVLCMECGRPGNGIVTARKGGHWLTISAQGRSAHAGVAAGRGRSALLAICREALRLAELDGSRDGVSANVTMLSAGEVLNSVASQATMTVDVRAWHPEDLEWALDRAAEFGPHDGVTLTLEVSTRVPPLERTPAVQALAGAAEQIGLELRSPVVEVETGGVSDACWSADAGLPTLDGLGPVGEDDHSPDERIEVSSLAHRCGLVAGLVATVEDGVLDAWRSAPSVSPARRGADRT